MMECEKCLELQQENERLESQFQGLDKAAGEVYRKYIDLQQSLHAAQQEVERLKVEGDALEKLCNQLGEKLATSLTHANAQRDRLQAENTRLIELLKRWRNCPNTPDVIIDTDAHLARRTGGEGL